MERRNKDWHNKQLQDAPIIPQVVLRLPMGDRIYGFISPNINDPIGTDPDEAIFDAGSFSTVPVIERAARLIDLSPLEESVQPIDPDVLGSWGQSTRPTLQFELTNDDKHFSAIVGSEYMLNQQVFLFLGFPGLGWDKSMQRYDGLIQRFTLTKKSLRIEAEMLC